MSQEAPPVRKNARGSITNAILETEQSDITVAQAYLQIVFARCIGKLNLVEKSHVGSKDLIYQTVSYISANFKKSVKKREKKHKKRNRKKRKYDGFWGI